MSKLTPSKAKQVFIDYLKEAGYKENTITGKMQYLKIFLHYVSTELKKEDLRDLGKGELKSFFSYLQELVSERTARPFAKRSKTALYGAVKLLFRCLYLKELILTNPCQDYEWKAKGGEQKRLVMGEEELALFLDKVDIDAYLGLRDRTIFELMYSSGLRVSEVSKLDIGDVDFTERMVLVRGGKWGKDRVEPVSEVAMKFLKLYVATRTEKNGPLFLSEGRRRLGGAAINRRVKEHLKAQGIYRPGLSAHSFRHATAVHLLAHGADLRYVQELLGHESIETTVIYTHELVENMRRIYKSYHPRENELYEEVDEAYLKRLAEFQSRLTWRKQKSAENRQRGRAWYERNREQILEKKREKKKQK